MIIMRVPKKNPNPKTHMTLHLLLKDLLTIIRSLLPVLIIPLLLMMLLLLLLLLIILMMMKMLDDDDDDD